MLKKSKLTQSVLDKIQSLKNKSVFSISKEYVLFIENSKLRLKEIQSYFVANCIPVCQNKWDTHFDTELLWKSIWAIIYSNRANRKTKQLQFKLLHNIVYTEDRLQRMGLSLNGSFLGKKRKLYYIYLYIVNLLTVSV
jgi:hypothetical protein